MQRGVRVEPLEHFDGSAEEINDLVSGCVGVAVARRRERVDAGCVFVEFVLPEVLECAGVREPVFLHGFEESGSTCGEKGRDGVCLWRRAAVGWVSAVTEVGPMDLWSACVSPSVLFMMQLRMWHTKDRATSSYPLAPRLDSYPRTASAEAVRLGR